MRFHLWLAIATSFASVHGTAPSTSYASERGAANRALLAFAARGTALDLANVRRHLSTAAVVSRVPDVNVTRRRELVALYARLFASLDCRNVPIASQITSRQQFATMLSRYRERSPFDRTMLLQIIDETSARCTRRANERRSWMEFEVERAQ